ncbi:MAG: NADH-quinone oxidoreductase subunit L [Bacteroidales bacterium 45-6]|nr:MAG: NADH-quinone oxidoreductase subunit L [Bacteroidales bacterium 45-6]
METSLALILILSPFIGFLYNLFAGKKTREISGIVATLAVTVSFVISVYFFQQVYVSKTPIVVHLFNWISLEGFTIGLDFLLDQLSLLWLLFVTGIGALIHLYSIGYMHDDENKDRFFAYLNLFVGFMLMLVMGGNLLVTFIGWEGVGLCSYLLIGFWYKNQSYNDAAKKAFIMNRIGDLGFLIGMFTLAHIFGTLDYAHMKAGFSLASLTSPTVFAGLTLAGVCLFIGATGKSAQLPLYTWLPDAMAGPTPVSALIHAATMVTGGIFLVTRMGFLYNVIPDVQLLIAIVGAATALFAATIGLMQTDIKKVLAYSTVSQLGLMFLALGVGAYSAAVFHVVTHAFFKACLFLGAGSVIHGLGGQQDIRKMGGVKSAMFVTYVTFFIATLAISGIFPFAGFFSKDEILLSTFEHNKLLLVIGSLASIMTAFYMFRALFLTFFGKFRGTEEEKHHIHESPKTMTIPLIVLAILSTLGGLLGIPGYSWISEYLAPVLPAVSEEAHHLGAMEYTLMGVALVGAIVGIAIAYFLYLSKKNVPSADEEKEGFGKVVYNKFYVDELYQAVVVKPVYALSSLFTNVFEKAIAYVVDGIGSLTGYISTQARLIQDGSIGTYLVAFVVGLCAILTYLFIL